MVNQVVEEDLKTDSTNTGNNDEEDRVITPEQVVKHPPQAVAAGASTEINAMNGKHDTTVRPPPVVDGTTSVTQEEAQVQAGKGSGPKPTGSGSRKMRTFPAEGEISDSDCTD